MIEEAQYDLLLDRIYDAALDPAGWGGVLESLSDAMNSRAFAIFFQDRGTIRFNRFNGMDGKDIDNYVRHYGAINPWAPEYSRRPDKIVGHELVGQRALERSEFYNDWLRPLGLHDCIGLPVRHEGSSIFLVSGLREKKAGHYTQADRALATRLAPHIQRAIQIHERLYAAQFMRDGLVQAMERLDVGVFLLDGLGQILFANRIAETILKKGDGLMHRHGRLHATDSAAEGEFDKILRQAAATSARKGSDAGGVVALRRAHGRPLTALIVPRRSERDLGFDASSVMVFVSSPKKDAALDEQHAARLYGLSAAEARLLKALLQGTRLADYADTAGITLNTAKGYLKQIFHKTDTSRQADLLRLFFADPVLRLASAKTRG